jgi:bifunctional non-homologous end joining protein LigD
MNALLERLDPDDKGMLRRAAMPAFTPPMLATLTDHAFSDPAWVYEPKLDGQRSLLWRRRSTVRLITRNEKDRTSHYPDLTEAIVRDETPSLIADGEIIAFAGDVTSFSRLQGRMQNARPSTAQVAAVPVYYYLFDLIWFDGYDLSALPLLHASRSSARRSPSRIPSASLSIWTRTESRRSTPRARRGGRVSLPSEPRLRTRTLGPRTGSSSSVATSRSSS